MLYTRNELIEITVAAIDKLCQHSFIAKSESTHLELRKANLACHEAVVIADFAENYTFTIQNEIQIYHWNKKQCTVHPIALFFKDDNSKLHERSFVCFSDDLNHDTAFVYSLQKRVGMLY